MCYNRGTFETYVRLWSLTLPDPHSQKAQKNKFFFAFYSFGSVAQLVEQRPEEPCVVGSSPTGATIDKKKDLWVFIFISASDSELGVEPAWFATLA